MMRVTPMVKYILIINIGISILQWLTPLPLNELGGLRVVFSDEWAPYQFITYMWLHDTRTLWHVLGNMFAIFIFGPLLEQFWGSKRFLIFYLACGIGAGILFGTADYFEKYDLKQDTEAYLDNPNPEDFKIFILKHKSPRYDLAKLADYADNYYEYPNILQYQNDTKEIVTTIYNDIANRPMVGASGAVFGILMAFAMLFPNTQLMLLFPPIPIKAKYFVLIYGLYEVYAEFSRTPGDNIAHLAHLGGMLIAFIMIKYWQKKSNRFY